MTEVWKCIPSFPGYEASNLGRIRSMDRMVKVTIKGKSVERRQRGRIRKVYDNGAGYMHLHITRNEHHYVHRLVAEAFLGPIPKGMWVCHNDGDPANNAADNLRYDTAKNNEADKKKHGMRKLGASHFAILTELQVRAIRELHPKFSQSELSKIFSVSQPTISRALSGFCWSEVTPNPNPNPMR
jgi:hypothetical protein